MCTYDRYTHMLHKAQFEYNDKLAEMCGPDVPKTSSWRIKMYDETGVNDKGAFFMHVTT